MMDRKYFEDMYADGDDPWDFEGSWYEQRKYALTMAALPRQRYERTFEPGCSIGVLSTLLATRTDELVAMELLPRVAAKARQRLGRNPGAVVLEGAIPRDWPEGSFDLIVLSEIAYYLSEAGLREALKKIEAGLREGGTLISVHYSLATNYPLKGRRVGQVLQQQPWLRQIANHSEESFELLVFEAC